MSTLSDRKLDANRQNALKSTGPRTETGKAKSSQNARKHDVFCKNLVAPGENPSDFLFFQRDMLLSLNPATCLELELAEQIIADRWRIKRVRAAEQAAYERMAEDAKVIATFDPRNDFSPDFFERQKQREKLNRVCNGQGALLPKTGARMLDSMMGNEQRIERLSKYEQRLQRSVYRALKELRELKEQEWPDELSELTIFLRNQLQDELDVLDGNVENEPTDDATAEAAEGSEENSPPAVTSVSSDERATSPENRDIPADEEPDSPPEPREAA